MPELTRGPEEEPPTSSVNTSKVSVFYIHGFGKLNFSFAVFYSNYCQPHFKLQCLHVLLFIHGVVSVALWQPTVETVTLRRGELSLMVEKEARTS